jgi:hypothetical protein
LHQETKVRHQIEAEWRFNYDKVARNSDFQ